MMCYYIILYYYKLYATNINIDIILINYNDNNEYVSLKF